MNPSGQQPQTNHAQTENRQVRQGAAGCDPNVQNEKHAVSQKKLASVTAFLCISLTSLAALAVSPFSWRTMEQEIAEDAEKEHGIHQTLRSLRPPVKNCPIHQT